MVGLFLYQLIKEDNKKSRSILERLFGFISFFNNTENVDLLCCSLFERLGMYNNQLNP